MIGPGKIDASHLSGSNHGAPTHTTHGAADAYGYDNTLLEKYFFHKS